MYASLYVNLDMNHMQVSENHIQPYMFHDIYFMCKLDLKLGYDMCELYAKFYMLVYMFRCKFNPLLCCINHICKFI